VHLPWPGSYQTAKNSTAVRRPREITGLTAEAAALRQAVRELREQIPALPTPRTQPEAAQTSPFCGPS
jgi:hypothetical protein